MGYIKEPEGVDFIIQSKPLSDKERKEISKFIQDYKEKYAGKKRVTKLITLTPKQKLECIPNCRYCFCIAPAFMPWQMYKQKPLGFSPSPLAKTLSAKANTIILN